MGSSLDGVATHAEAGSERDVRIFRMTVGASGLGANRAMISWTASLLFFPRAEASTSRWFASVKWGVSSLTVQR